MKGETLFLGNTTLVRVTPQPRQSVDDGPDTDGLVGEGVARCCPTDHYDPSVGEQIATGRALMDLGAKIAARGDAAVRTEDQYLDEMVLAEVTLPDRPDVIFIKAMSRRFGRELGEFAKLIGGDFIDES